MAGKKKYYAIAAGRRPGIYDDWPAALTQVEGYTGARFKGFPTREEAEQWLRNPVFTPGPAAKTRAKSAPSTPGNSPRTGEITIYTDGGCIRNPGPGGYGIVQIDHDELKERSGGFRLTTNNRMELMGCIVALRGLKRRDRPVTLYTDSNYVVNGIRKGWAKSWRKRGWVKSDNKPAMNPDLWAELLDLVGDLDITFEWVKGHAGNPLNERCDELALYSAKQKGLPEDHGYKGQP